VTGRTAGSGVTVLIINRSNSYGNIDFARRPPVCTRGVMGRSRKSVKAEPKRIRSKYQSG